MQIIASYPIGGRIDSVKLAWIALLLVNTTTQDVLPGSTTGESIPQQYKRLFATRPFNEIKTGLNYRVSQVKLQKRLLSISILMGSTQSTLPSG